MPIPNHTITVRASGLSIGTERLVLRVPRPEHYEAYAEMSADPETFRYSDRGPMTSEESWTRLLRHAGHWSLLGYGVFAVEEKASGRFVGEAGFGDFKRKLGADFDMYPEAAWSFAPWAKGSGYATEAAAAALNWLEGELSPERTVCLIHVDNQASIRVAEKLDYRPFRERVYRGDRSLLFQRNRSA